VKRKHLFKALLLSTTIAFTFTLRGQALNPGETRSKEKKFKLDPDRMVVGGGFGATFGNITLVEVAPNFGYFISDQFLAGFSARYIYYRQRSSVFGQTFTFETNIYGGGVFAQYFFFEEFFGHTELEILNLDDIANENNRVNVTSIFIGGGYRSFFTSNSFASIMLLYNINDDINSPYTNPVIRFGFSFGL